MPKLARASLLPIYLLLALPAAAQATQQEADRLKAVFETYAGATPGVVTVKPDGESYAVSLDGSPLLDRLPLPDLSVTASPYAFSMKPLGGGKWRVSGQSAQALTLKMAGFLNVVWKSDSASFSGTFDEALMSFTEMKNEAGGTTFDETIDAPEGRTEVHQRIAKATSRVFDVRGTADSLDFAYESEQEGISGSYSAPLPSPAGPWIFEAQYDVKKVSGGGKIAGLRNRQIMDLWGFAAANASAEAMKRNQEQLKAKLTAALPIVTRIDAMASYANVAVTTKEGRFTAGKVGGSIDWDLSGNRIEETISVEGLSLPTGLAPTWVEALIPAQALVTASLDGMRLGELARVLVANLDLNLDPPLKPGSELQLAAAAMPLDGRFRVEMSSLLLKGRNCDLTASGNIALGIFATDGKAQVTMNGLDAVIDVLAASGDSKAQDMKQFAEAAKRLAKPGANGADTWEIVGSMAKGIFVNGTLVVPPR